MLTLTLTKKTLITWVAPWTPEDEVTYAEGASLREEKIADMTTLSKTDGIGAIAEDSVANTHERHWIDEAAAKEYIAFIVDLVDHGKLPGIVKTEVADYHAIVEAAPATVV